MGCVCCLQERQGSGSRAGAKGSAVGASTAAGLYGQHAGLSAAGVL